MTLESTRGGSSGIETVDVIDPWLYATLSSDPELQELLGGDDRIGPGLTDFARGAGDLWLTWNSQAPRDVRAVGKVRVWIDALYTVKAVGRTASFGTVAPVARRIDLLLDGASATTETGELSCIRESIVQYPELSNSTQFRHLGAVYRFRANSH